MYSSEHSSIFTNKAPRSQALTGMRGQPFTGRNGIGECYGNHAALIESGLVFAGPRI